MVILTYIIEYNYKNIHYINYVMTPHFRYKLFMTYYNIHYGNLVFGANRNHLFSW